jgi:hypothetical protein
VADAPTPSLIFELHSADRIVRAIVYEELDRVGLRPNLLPVLALIGLRRREGFSRL